MADIFISFIHEEQIVATAVQRLLKRHFGHDKVFMSSDQWQVFAGEVWLDRIKEELSAARIAILMLSTRSVERPWVNFEAGAAWLTGKAVIPVCFGDLTKAALPKPYSGIQALDLPAETYYMLVSISHYLPLTLAPLPFLSGDNSETEELTQAIESLQHT